MHVRTLAALPLLLLTLAPLPLTHANHACDGPSAEHLWLDAEGAAVGSVAGTVENQDADVYMLDRPVGATRLDLVLTAGPSTGVWLHGGVGAIAEPLANRVTFTVTERSGALVDSVTLGTGSTDHMGIDLAPTGDYCLRISLASAAGEHPEVLYAVEYAFTPA